MSLVTAGAATYAESAHPDKPHSSDDFVQVKSAAAQAFYRILPPQVARGRGFTLAKLYIPQRNTLTGSRDYTAKRCTGDFTPAKITWNKRPTVTGSGTTVTVAGGSAGDYIVFDVLADMNTWSAGGALTGWRIETTDTTARWLRSFREGEPLPYLELEWDPAPAQPTDISPAGVIGVGAPIVTWPYADPTPLQAIRVQADAAADETSLDFDSGILSTTLAQLDLATTAFAALANNASTYLRVFVFNGAWSDPSDWVSIKRVNKLTLTDTSGSSTADASPTSTWSVAGGTQAAWQVRWWKSGAPNKILADSGKQPGADSGWQTPPLTLPDIGSYVREIRVWDNQPRGGTGTDTPYTAVTTTVTYAHSASVSAPTSLTVAQIPDTPGFSLTPTRGTTPDAWAFYRDNVHVATVDAGDLVSGAWTDWAAEPNTQHTWKVKAVENGAISSGSATSSTLSADVDGIWLIDGLGRAVSFSGDAPKANMPEDAAVYTMLDGTVVKISSNQQGLTDQLATLGIEPYKNRTVADQVADVIAYKQRPTAVYRLAWGHTNIPIVWRGLAWAESSDNVAAYGQADALSGFEFWQAGERDWAVA